MTNHYNVDIQGFVTEYDNLIIEADDNEHAEMLAHEQIREIYPDWVDPSIVRITENN